MTKNSRSLFFLLWQRLAATQENKMKADSPSKQADTDSCVEAQLVQACLHNHSSWEDQLTAWLASDNEWLKRRCYSLLGNRADAEDAAQEVTLKAVRGITRFEGRSSLRTWVGRIADNHCFSLIKKRRSQVLTDHLQHCIALVEADRYSEVAPEASEQTAARVHSTLERLTEKNRKILELRYFDELSIQQMAETLNLTQSATKMRLYRAMDVFKVKFKIVHA